MVDTVSASRLVSTEVDQLQLAVTCGDCRVLIIEGNSDLRETLTEALGRKRGSRWRCRRARRAPGADRFLTKPCAPDELEGSIREVLAERRST
jgi:hypothetical protein